MADCEICYLIRNSAPDAKFAAQELIFAMHLTTRPASRSYEFPCPLFCYHPRPLLIHRTMMRAEIVIASSMPFLLDEFAVNPWRKLTNKVGQESP